MPRLRTTAALSLALLAPPARAADPVLQATPLQESAAQAAARDYVAALCRSQRSACADAQAVRDGYFAALADATACDAGPCKLERVGSLAVALADLDRREGDLPREPGAAGRPLLGVSAIATGRLTRAATKLGQPYAADRRTGGPADAVKAAEGFCVSDAARCEAMRGLVDADAPLREQVAGCAAARCPFVNIDPLAAKAAADLSRYFDVAAGAKTDTLSIFILLNATRNRAIAAYAIAADAALADLKKGADGLQTQLDRAEKDESAPLDGVTASGQALFAQNRNTAVGADRLAFFLGYDDRKNGVQTRRDEVNAESARLAGLRARALALRAARGLGGEEKDALSAPSGAPPAAAAAQKAAAAATPTTLLDRRLVPIAPQGTLPAPPIIPGNPSTLETLKNSFSDDPTKNADALRRLGRTATVGNPGLYAKQAFSQEDESTCAIAAQVELLRAQGLLPTDEDPHVQEKRLMQEAKSKGFMQEGTPPEFRGSLLIERGLIVVKKHNVGRTELADAVRRGNPLQVGVNARVLWNEGPGDPEPHSILVVGAEVAKSDGRILGVYVDDTGLTPPGAGTFYPWGKFLSAWRGDIAEVR